MQPLGQLMPRALAELVRHQPLSHGKVEFAWRTAVGPGMARATAVRLENGVLLVEAQTPQWSSATMRSSRIILSRMQGLLGADAIHDIRLRA